MDTFNKLSTPAKLVLGATVLFLIVSFFNWFSVEDLGGVSMWEGIGTLAGILAIAVLVWEGLRLANVDIKLPVSHAMVSVLLTLLVLLFAFIRFIDKPGGELVSDAFDRTIWSWLGLLFAIIMVVGAVMQMQAGGESLADMRRSMGSAASSATSRARDAVDRDDAPAATPPSTTPPSTTPPSTTEGPSDTSDDTPRTTP
jgi:hypothetical protein